MNFKFLSVFLLSIFFSVSFAGAAYDPIACDPLLSRIEHVCNVLKNFVLDSKAVAVVEQAEVASVAPVPVADVPVTSEAPRAPQASVSGFDRFKEVVVNNQIKTAVAVVATVAVISAVVAYAKSANEVVTEEKENDPA